MTTRIVVTGPESTGKTTLAAALGRYLDAPVVPEAARIHAESAVPRPLSAADVEPIARLAQRLDDAAHQAVHGAVPAVVVLDTDLISTVVYARHYYGSVAPWIEHEAHARRADLYLLCATDLPWVADAVRDDADTRALLAERFADAMREFRCVAVPIAGLGDERLACTCAAVDSHLRMPERSARR